ncbi:DUF6993 domain-containing protein [Microbacterium sp. P07]|uniref:DUF6993 domain-containing protein n=1 Tax=Microbacterium sp. P07 TaxID=3366952 RepID=UPI0037459A4B
MNRSTAPRRAGLIALALAVTTVLAGCTNGGETPPEPTRSSADPSASSSAAPAPELVPEGDASENLPLFTQIVQGVTAGPDVGRSYVDALVAGGFDKASMQVTEDLTTVGNAAESIQFSVRWGEECLVGQVGPATGQPVTVVMSGLASGGCLVGNTRPIDW